MVTIGDHEEKVGLVANEQEEKVGDQEEQDGLVKQEKQDVEQEDQDSLIGDKWEVSE